MSKQKEDIDLLKRLTKLTKCRANFGIGTRKNGGRIIIVPRGHDLSPAEIAFGKRAPWMAVE